MTRLLIGSSSDQPVLKNNETRHHHAGGDGGVGRHVKECAANIEIAFPAAGEHPGGYAVDDDPGRGHPDHR